MHYIRSLTLITLFITGISSYVTPNEARGEPDHVAFRSLLEQADPTVLHEALHQATPDKFRDGVFEKDILAIEAVHRDDPPLATRVLELARRVDNSTAISTVVGPGVTHTM